MNKSKTELLATLHKASRVLPYNPNKCRNLINIVTKQVQLPPVDCWIHSKGHITQHLNSIIETLINFVTTS